MYYRRVDSQFRFHTNSNRITLQLRNNLKREPAMAKAQQARFTIVYSCLPLYTVVCLFVIQFMENCNSFLRGVYTPQSAFLSNQFTAKTKIPYCIYVDEEKITGSKTLVPCIKKSPPLASGFPNLLSQVSTVSHNK